MYAFAELMALQRAIDLRHKHVAEQETKHLQLPYCVTKSRFNVRTSYGNFLSEVKTKHHDTASLLKEC